MFKSLFTKYVSAFMAIIFISFVILALVLYGMVNNYSADFKTDAVERTAQVVSESITELFVADGKEVFEQFVFIENEEDPGKPYIKMLLSALADYNSDVHVILLKSNGEYLLSDVNTPETYLKSNIPADVMDKLLTQNQYSETGDLGGALEKQDLVHICPITDKDGNIVGATLVCSESKQEATLVETMVKTIILSCLWVMLAALVAIYVISDKIIDPLKQMSKAAKQFAKGKFDVRVPVRGRDEVAELATAFNNMAASMAKLEDMRRTFLSNVSHDLRTPMTTISGFIDGIIDGTIPPEKHEYYLDVIRVEIRRLARLVASLLNITRIQAGERKFTKSAFDICEMARLILISFEQKIDAKRLDVEFEAKADKMMVWADHDAIYQILYNICDNAVKFSNEGGKYRISILERQNKVYVSVFNEGKGIPADELPMVFERFYKSDKSRGLDKTGVGLGLYIAKTIIDAHDEEIWVKSVYGENCEFVFTLPYTPESEAVVKD